MSTTPKQSTAAAAKRNAANAASAAKAVKGGAAHPPSPVLPTVDDVLTRVDREIRAALEAAEATAGQRRAEFDAAKAALDSAEADRKRLAAAVKALA